MYSLKRWCVVVLAMGFPAGVVQAQDGQGPSVEQPKAKVQAGTQAKRPARTAVVRFASGTALDGALVKLQLADDVKTKAAAALKAFRDKAAEDAKALGDKQKELKEKIRAESDAAKKKELAGQAAKLKGPTDVEKYAAAKAAVRDLLTEEQLGQLDGLARTTAVELATKVIDGQVAGWAKKGVELSDEQKAKVEAAAAKVKEDAGKLEAGAIRQAQSLAMKAVWDLRKSVLTEEQQTKLTPPKTEKPKTEAPKTDAPKPVPAPRGEGET